MHFVLQHFFSLVLIDAECLNKGQTDRYHPLNWKIITAAPKRRNPRRSVNHYHLVLGHANSQSRWRNQVFSSTLEAKRDQRALISGIMEWNGSKSSLSPACTLHSSCWDPRGRKRSLALLLLPTVPLPQTTKSTCSLFKDFPFWDGYKHSVVHLYNRRNLKLQPIF